MARIRITKCPMQTGGITDNNAPQLYSANGEQQWQGQGIDFRSKDPNAPMLPFMNIQKPLFPHLPMMGNDQMTYGNYGQGANYEAVGQGAAGDVFGNAHGIYQKGGRTSIYVDSKNDPRYRAYQDSLLANKQYRNWAVSQAHNSDMVDMGVSNGRRTFIPNQPGVGNETSKRVKPYPVQPVQISSLPDISIQQQNFAPNVQQPEMYNTQMPYMPWHEQSQGMPYYDKRTGQMAGTSTGDVDSNQYSFQFGGTRKTSRIRITGIPSMNEQMATGGYANKGATHGYGDQQPGNGYALNRNWGTLDGPPDIYGQKQPFAQIGKTLPEADGEGDINIEKKEVVLGDFDQDGNQETLRADAPPHTQGGMNVDVPSNSFVFSDTKDLKIKDPKILEIFGMKPKKGGYTPATIAAKYDLNKFKAVTANPHADENSKDTAQLMSDNYMKKLNALAAVQEGMKKQMGLDNSAPPQQPMMQHGGNYYPIDAHRGAKGTTWSNWQLQNGAEDIGYPNDPNGQGFGPWLNSAHPDLVNYVNGRFGRPNTYTPDNPIGSEWGLRHQYAIERGMGQNLPELDVQRHPMMPPVIQQPNPDTVQTGIIPYFNTGTEPTTPANDQVVRALKADKEPRKSWKGLPAMNPNTLGDALNLLQMSQVKRFQPFEPAPNAVIPDTVFLDPTRAIAATQEAANSGMASDAFSANSRAARATGLARQGQAGEQAANIIGQYDNQNNQIANGANTNAAQITNQLMAQQANRLAEMNKANFLSDRDYKREMGKLQAEYVGRLQEHHDQNVKTTWLNKTSPYFNIDPITQMPVFKSPEAKATYERMYNGQRATGDIGAKVNAYYTQLLKQPAYQSEAGQRAALALAQKMAGAAEHMDIDYSGMGTQKGMSEKDVYSGPQQYGGLSKFQLGGDYIGVASAPNPYEGSGLQPQAADNTYIPQPPIMQSQMPRKGDIATTTNNPGNMKWSPWMRKVGGMPSGIPGKDGGQFAAFPDLESGLHAYQAGLFGAVDGIRTSKYYNSNTPVDKALKTWSNNGYGASIYPDIKGKTLGQLTSAERNELMKRQIKQESGSMYKTLKARGVFS